MAGDTYTWSGSNTGDWDNAANWLDETTGQPAEAPPGANDAVSIDNSGQLITISGSGAATSLTIEGLLALSGQVTTDYLGVGDAISGTLALIDAATLSVVGSANIATQAGGTSSVSVDGANTTLTVAGYLNVGFDGSGALSVGAGGTLSQTLSTGSIVVGNLAGSTGDLTVDGSGSSVTDAGWFAVGFDGGGTLLLTNGAAVNADNGMAIADEPGSSGAVSVASGSTLDASNLLIAQANNATGSVAVDGAKSNLTVATYFGIGSAGHGSLSLSDGGSVLAQGGFAVGGPGGTGVVSIAGAGSVLTSEAYINVGDASSGTLSISDGGSLDEQVDNIAVGNQAGSTGAVTLDGAGSSLTDAGWFVVGYFGDGSVALTNGATADAENGLTVGDESGASGSVSVSSGSSLDATNVVVGQISGSTGSVAVDGAGSILTVATYFGIGSASQGSLSISDGGSVSAQGGFAVGGPNGSGDVTISGAGSILTSGSYINIGDSGVGTLAISDGGSLVEQVDNIAIGNQVGSTGAVTIDGQGSTLTNTGWTAVGLQGSGALSLTNGAAVNAENGLEIGDEAGSSGAVSIASGSSIKTAGLSIAQNANSNGSVTVDGAGSSLTSTAYLVVATSGGGSLTVSDGASVVANNGLNIAVGTGGVGTITVEGAGSSLTSNTYMDVGDDGSATLLIEGGASVAQTITGSDLSIGYSAGSTGAVTVDGQGSSLTAVSELLVGYQGKGTLSLSNGASLQSDNGFSIGSLASATGSVTVTSGAQINAQSVGVGFFGNGSLTISTDAGGAGTFTTGFVDIGQEAGSTGTVTLTGAGSALNSSNTVIIGDGGIGSMTVSDGAAMSVADYLLVGYNLDAANANDTNGVLTVSDATITVGASGVGIGSNGIGTLNLEAGGVISNAGGVFVGAGSEISFSGGSFQTGIGFKNEGDIVGFGSLTGGVDNESTIEANGGTLTISGGIGGGGVSKIDTSATLAVSGVLEQAVDFAGSDGVLQLDQPTQFTGVLQGLTAGDTIDLAGAQMTGPVSLTATSLEITTNLGVLTYAVSGNVSQLGVSSESDSAGGTDLVFGSVARSLSLAAPSTASVIQSSGSIIPGISLAETGASAGELFTVEVKAVSGSLSASGAGVAGSGTDDLIVSGTLTQVNADLAILADTEASTSGDTLTLSAKDNLGNAANQTTIGLAVGQPAGSFDWSGAIAASWSTAADWTDVTNPANPTPASVAPGSNDAVTIAGGTSLTTVVSGAGAAASLAMSGDVSFTGNVAAGSLTQSSGVLSLQPGAVLSDSGSASFQNGTLTVDGGALSVAGAATFNGETINVQNNASVEVGNLSTPYYVFTTVDSTSTFEVGSSNAAVAGEFLVDAGSSASAGYTGSYLRVTAPTIVNDGTLNGGLYQSSGSITNNGVAGLNSSTAALYLELTGSSSSSIVNNGVIGGLSASGSVTVLAQEPNGSPGDIVNNNTIDGDGSLTLFGQVSGTGQINLAANTTLNLEGILGAGQSVNLLGSEDVIQLSTYNDAQSGPEPVASIAGNITGFGANDAILYQGTVTSAAWANNVLTLLDGTTAVATLNLVGNYGSASFIAIQNGGETQISELGSGDTTTAPAGTSSADAYAWSGAIAGSWDSASSWTDTTTSSAPASVAPGSNDAVTIAGGTSLTTVVSGAGAAASLAMSGDVSFTGNVAAGSLTQSSGVLSLQPGAVLSDSGSASFQNGTLTVDGGALSVAGAATFNGETINVQNNASVEVGNLSTPYYVFTTVDSTSTFEVGSSNAAVAGEFLVDAGSSASAGYTGSYLRVTAPTIVNDGTLNGGLYQSSGSITNNGVAGLNSSTAALYLELTGSSSSSIVNNGVIGGLSASGSVTVLAQEPNGSPGDIVNNNTIDGDGSLTLFGQVSGTGQINLAANTTLNLEGILGAGQSVNLLGSEDVIQLSTYNDAQSGPEPVASIAGNITGFGANDAILYQGTVTSAAWANNVLTLLDGTTAVATLNLVGNYGSASFIAIQNGGETQISELGSGDTTTAPAGTSSADAYAWSGAIAGSWDSASSWTDTTTSSAPASVAPGSNDAVTIAGGTSLTTVVSGAGAAASLAMSGDVSFTGNVAAGSLTQSSGVLSLQPGAVLSDSGSASFQNGTLTVDGGALSVAGAATFNGETINVQNNASVEVGNLSTPYYVFTTVDSTSTFEVGSSNAAVAGEFLVDAGSSASAGYTGSYLRVTAPTIVNDGTLNGGLYQSSGSITNNGVAGLNSSTAALYLELTGSSSSSIVNNGVIGGLSASGSVTVLAQEPNGSPGDIVNNNTIDGDGSLTLFGQVSGTGQINLAANTTLNLEGILGAGQSVNLLGSEDVIQLSTYNDAQSGPEPVASIAGNITGFGANDAILYQGTVTSAAWANNVLTLLDGTTAVATLNLVGNYGSASFIAIQNGGETQISLSGIQGPTLSDAGAASYSGGGAPAPVAPSLSISDPNPGATLASAEVAITAGFLAGDQLDFTNQSGITGSFNSSTGVLTLSGVASVSAYQTALESVSFSSSAADPTNAGADASRSMTTWVYDGTEYSNGLVSSVSVSAAPQSPAGFYLPPGATTPIEDPAGTYSGAGAIAPLTDPAGTYSAAGASSPTTDPAGSYSGSGASAPTIDPAGTFSGAGASAAIPAAAGNYIPNAGATSASAEVVDPAGTYSGPGASAPTTDPLGYFSAPGASAPTLDPAGYYSPPGSSAPILDPAGFYSPVGSSAPNVSPAGSYSPAGSSAPTPDAPGSYSGAGAGAPTTDPAGTYSGAQASAPTLDAPGTYSGPGASAPTLAPAGTYISASGATSLSAALTDPAGYWSAAGASAPTEDAAGTYSAAGAASPTIDPAGTYSGPGASAPTKDPAGTYSAAGASAPTEDPAGTHSAAGASAPIIDAAGTYSAAGASVATKDSAGTYSAAGASAPTADPAGTYSGAGASAPTPVAAGTYSATIGATSAATATQDPAGTYSPAGASAPTLDPAGTYSNVGAGAPTKDPAGTYSLSGASAPTQDPAGTFSAAGASAPSQDPAGTYSAAGAASATKDPAGTYSAAGATAPTQDPAGAYSAAGASAPIIDPAGTYSAAGASAATKDPAGTYSAAGASAPTQDPAGTYSGAGASAPITDPAGTYSAAGASASTKDAGGTYSAAGASAATTDPAGTYSGAGASAPTTDLPGTYSGPGASVATKDPAGTYSAAGASAPTQDPAGSFSGAGASAPTQDPAGTYSAAGASVATKDPAGTYSAAGATAPITDPAGTYSAAGASAPTADPAGTFSLAGATAATKDPSGTYSGSGASAPTQDPAGSFSAAGASAPTTDLAGTYSDPGASAATKDPAGTYSAAGASAPILDPPGTYSAAGAPAPTTDAAGTYSGAGASAATKDPAGTYSPAGAAAPTQDPAGTYSVAGASAPTQDPAGTYSDPGASAPTKIDMWTGPSTLTSWFTAADWSSGVPTAAVYAEVSGSTVFMPSTATAYGLIVQNGYAYNNGGTLTLNGSGGASNPNGVMYINSGGTFQLDYSLHGSAINIASGGELFVSPSLGSFVVTQTINDNGQVLIANAPATLTGAVSGAGVVEVENTSASFNSALTSGVSVQVLGSGYATFNAAVTGSGGFSVSNSGSLEFAAADSEAVNFLTGSTGVLKLDHSLTAPMTGTISGLTATNGVDLADLNYVAGQMQASYSGTAAGGSLTVSNGAQSVSLKLAGNYLSSTWTLSADKTGGTMVIDPPAGAPASPSEASRSLEVVSDTVVSMNRLALFSQLAASMHAPLSDGAALPLADFTPSVRPMLAHPAM